MTPGTPAVTASATIGETQSVSYSRHVADGELQQFQTEEFEDWLRRLRDRQAKFRILQRIDRLMHGNPGDVAPVGEGVSELRMHFGPGYRVYFLQDRDILIVLLAGGDKSTQQADIEMAHELANEWREEQKNNGKR